MTDRPEESSEFQKYLGYRLTHWAAGEAQMELEIQPWSANRSGVPHGGIHATLLDTVMGYAGNWTPPGEPRFFALTLTLTVNYLGRPTGRLLIAEGRLTGGGANTFFSEGKVTDETGTLIATGSAAYRRRKPTQPGI